MRRSVPALLVLLVLVVSLAVAAWMFGLGSSTPVVPPVVDGGSTVEAEASSAAVAGEGAPNVLIVLWDTVRADRMSLYGHDRPTTPWLEGFAEGAVVYERAISPAMWTVPSHASLFTGLPVASHGANARWIWLDDRFETLAERLGGAGYDTFAFSSNPYLSPSTNLLQGFDTVVLSWDGPWAEATARATSGKLMERDRSVEISPSWRPSGRGEGWPEHLTTHKDGGTVLADAMLDWLDERGGEGPWLAYLNYLEAHHPRVPSAEARSAVLPPELAERGLQVDASLFHTMAYMEGRHAFDDEELEAVAGVYDATLRDLDAATARLVAGLEARGILDDTVVVILSDHGEHLGEHGMFDHRWSVWQELLHVPLVIRYPEALAPGRVAEPVSTADVFATVLELAGLPAAEVPSRSLVGEPAGRAFAELIQPTPRLPVVRRAFDDLDPNRWRHRYQVLVDGTFKFVRVSDGHHRLYDLDADPAEATDLVAAEPERAEAMKQAVIEWQESLPPYDPALRGPGDRPKAALRASGTREQLEALGYAE